MKCGTSRIENDVATPEEHKEAAFLALVKIYDNYITPLESRVQCWKHGRNEDYFLLGMTITKPAFIVGADSEMFYIVYNMPKKYWNMTKVMEVTIVPPYNVEDNISNLLRL